MKFCQSCTAQKPQQPRVKKAWFRFMVCVSLLSVIVGCANGVSNTSASPSSTSALPSAPVSTAPSPSAAPTGIDPARFIPAVEAYIIDLNAKNTDIGDLTVKISVTYIIGFVDITLTDMTSWSRFSDTEKKDYIITLGKALDALAADNIYPDTHSAVGTDTVLYSPSGQELAERTSLGIVMLYEK